MKRWRVVERVEFEYVWIVESTTKPSRAEAGEVIAAKGDGEAESHDETSRAVVSVEPMPGGAV